MKYDYYLHAAGQSSRWGVVDVGLKCMHSCKFCYYSYLNGEDDQFIGMRHAEFHSKENLITLVQSMAENGFLGFDVTGGEPTLHPNMPEIIAEAKRLGLSSRIITLGQYLMRKMNKSPNILLDDLMNAGVTNFLFSMHDIEEERFKKITGESWAKLQLAMNELDKRDFHYCSNTTVFEENYRYLPYIAEEILKHNIYLHNFILMNAYYAWSDAGRAAPIQADYAKVYPYIKKAVQILENGGVGVNIRYAPMCTMPGLEKNIVGVVGVRHDPYEWMNNIHHGADPKQITPVHARVMGQRIQGVQPYSPPPGSEIQLSGQADPWAVRGNNYKVFPAGCKNCNAVSVCDGFDPRYAEEKKPTPVPYTKIRGEVRKFGDNNVACHLDIDRLNYLAPFFVKLSPEAKMKNVVANSFNPKPFPEIPTVAIIIPCYNQGQYLERAIQSALSQTHKCQVIVVDDCSTDNTSDIAKKFSEVHLVRIDTNQGQPAITRNWGIYSAGKVDFILPLDADDWIDSSMVESCLDALRKNSHASIAYPGTQTFGNDDVVWENGQWQYQNHLYQNQFVYCSLYKREIWENVGGYKDNVKGCEDFNFWVSAAALGYRAVPVQRALFHYRTNNEGLYESEVKPNFDQKYRQIVLNNHVAYPASMVRQANAGDSIDRIIE